MTTLDPELCRCGHLHKDHDKLLPQACRVEGCWCEDFVPRDEED